MSRALYRLGRFAAHRPWMTIGMWIVLAVGVIGGGSTLGARLEDSFDAPGLDSSRAVELLERAGADEAGLTATVVATPINQRATFDESAPARADLAELRAALTALPSVVGVGDPLAESAVDDAAEQRTLSADGRVALVRVQYPVMNELSRDDLHQLKDAIADAGAGSSLRLEAGGDLFFSFEEPSSGIGEVLGLVAAMVILLLAFGSVVAMGLPIGLALFGVVLGLAAMPLIAHVIEIPTAAPQMSAMVGLGVGIDYALFLVTRYREHLAAGMAVDEAIARAVATAGEAVLFAGGTVVVAILGLAVAGVPFVTAVGIAVATVVLVMVAASLTLLPAVLGLVGHNIDRFGLPWRSRTTVAAAPSDRWRRWGAHVTRHAVAYTVGVTVVLLAAAAPVLALQLGIPDEGTLPETRTERQAYDLVAEAFGPGTNGPLVVAVDVSLDASVVEPLRVAIADDPGIASVEVAVVDDASGVAALLAIPTTAPQDAATRVTVERLRTEVLPDVLAGTSASAHVGGQTAAFADLGARIEDRLPWFVAAVVLLSFLLLTVVFRSILVPLKAALLNLLSIGAAYGVLVVVFQWGWGGSLIGLESTVPIVSFIPLLMFAIVFGLSMDYEVFLLSRIREHYRETGDNEAAVVHGLASTARVITCAALIMVAVFSGFVLGDDPTVKMFGVGLATAILVDATVVRMVLVPATMRLLGDANWWLPAWLDRRLPHMDFDSDVDSDRDSRPSGNGLPGRAAVGAGVGGTGAVVDRGEGPGGQVAGVVDPIGGRLREQTHVAVGVGAHHLAVDDELAGEVVDVGRNRT